MSDEGEKIEVVAKKSWPIVMSWVGGITALIGLFASIGGGVTWLINHHRQNSERVAKIALAQAQAGQMEYQASLKTYADILKDDPLDGPALDGQLDTAMQWVENFSVYVREGQDEGDISAPALDQILPILTSGLTRVRGARAADVEAHLGWAHFLNETIAQREGSSIAEEDWRAALAMDADNAYANAMLGNWLLRTSGHLSEATRHFEKAVATGRARPFVRNLQIGALVYLDETGARAELIKVANAMRKGNEALEPGDRHRILGWCFDPSVTDHKEMVEVLSAVPPDDVWNTYLWLDDHLTPDETDDWQQLKHAFIHANLLEVTGKIAEALTEFRRIQQRLGNRPGSLQNGVNAAIARLTRNSS